MALKDLKSDLTKAFKRIPAGGKLEKRAEGPTASNYSAKPKPYRIPNDGRGTQVKYNSSSGTYEAKSRFNDVQNKSQISGRHSSNIEPKKTEPKGRHDNVDIKLNELAPTPVKTAVEPIAMSATPVKQGLTPTLMSEPIKQPGTTPEKIAISGYVDNQPPDIDNTQYSFDIGEGALAQLQGASKFDIDKLTESYFTSGMFTTSLFTTSNGISTIAPSDLKIQNDSTPYAPSGYAIDRLSRYFTPIRDAIDLDKEFGTEKSDNMMFTGEIDSYNPVVQVHGSNISIPYSVDLESAITTNSFYPDIDNDGLQQVSELRFFTDHAKLNESGDELNHSPKAVNPNNGWYYLTDQFNDIHSGFVNANTIPVPYKLNWFGNNDGTVDAYYSDETLSVYDGSPSKLSSNGLNLGFDPEGVEGLNNMGGKNMLSLSDQLPGNGNNPDQLNMFFKHSGASMVTGTTNPFGNYNFYIPGFRATDNPNGGQNPTTTPATPGYNPDNTNNAHEGTDFLFLNIDGLTTGDFFAKGRIGFDSGASVFRTFDETQNFFNQDNPLMENGFNPQFNGKQLVLTGPWWDWTLGNVELTEYDWIQNEENNPSIFSVDNDPNNGTVNFFSLNSTGAVENLFHYGFEKEMAPALIGDWHSWTHSDTVVSRYVGIDGNDYNSPSIYVTDNNKTNFFDIAGDYTEQFTRNIQTAGLAIGSTNYVNIGDGEYNAIEINGNSNYSFGQLFNTQISYWKNLDLYLNLNRFTYEDGIKSFGHIETIYTRRFGAVTSGYAPSGLHSDPSNSSGLGTSEYFDEPMGSYKHEINPNWSYWNMIGTENSQWGSGISNFSPNLKGGTPGTNSPIFKYFGNGISSWIETNTELGGDELDSIENNLIYFHPGYKPEDDIPTYGYGLGLTTHLQFWTNSITIGSGKYMKNIAWRNPFGQKHVSYLEGDQTGLVTKRNRWLEKGYMWGDAMYGTKKGLSSGGFMGISTGRDGRSGDLWLNPYDPENQIFDSFGVGLDSMGGIGYYERMMNIYQENTTSRSMAGSILNNLNPFDNIQGIWQQMKTSFDDTVKRWWQQHNRFAIQMSNNPPKGSHQGLPGDSATGAVGRFSGMLNSVSTGGADLISTITGLSARKYWSVQSYTGLQVSAEIIDTGITRFNDFRMFISDMGAVHVGLSGPANYLANNIHKRYGYPASGTPGLDRKQYYKHIPGMGDDITMEDFYTGDALPDDKAKDYIKFFLKDVVNDHTFRFRAYISGLTDSVQPNWSQYNYVGRPDPVFQYNGVSARTISFNLKVAALAQQDMYWMWKKINKMVGMCYPSGYENGQFMTSPMMELTLGDYVYEAPCFLNALTISVPDDSPWEINQMKGSGGPFDNLANSVASVTNVVNDPLGTMVNIGASMIQGESDDKPVQARKNHKNYPFDELGVSGGGQALETSGDLLAQLPHIVDLSLGFTIIGKQAKSSLSTHFGDRKQIGFFDGYDKDAGVGTGTTQGPPSLGGFADFVGL